MTKLPRDLPGDRLIRALGRAGWYVDHQVGSHVTLRNPAHSGFKLVVPVRIPSPLVGEGEGEGGGSDRLWQL